MRVNGSWTSFGDTISIFDSLEVHRDKSSYLLDARPCGGELVVIWSDSRGMAWRARKCMSCL